MVCPKCGNEQPDIFSQCQKCRYVFPRQQSIQSTRSPQRTAASGSVHPAVVILGLLAIAFVLVLALWWLNTSEGLPVFEGSYVNTANKFAMLAPADWTVLTSDNYNELFEKLGDRFPKTLRDGLSSRQTEVGFMKILEDAEFSPSVNVVIVKSDVPALDEEQLAEGSRVLSEGFRKLLDNYALEKSELITVDELTAAQFTHKGSLQLRVEKPATGERGAGSSYEWKSFGLRFVQTLIPGKGRGYVITSSALESQFPEYKKNFDSILDSFRVLQRPSRFGSIVMGGLNGGLGSALAYLLFAAFMKIIGLFKKEQISVLPPPM